MSEPLISYPVPWKLLFNLGPHLVDRTPTSVDAFSAGVCEQMRPEPLITGWEHLPESARFVLVANHYQRKGLWILHAAAALTQLIRKHYGPGDPPVRWIATANWPRISIGPFSFPSPGDALLPRVADALACYPVSFAGTNRNFTAQSVRRVLREMPTAQRPLGLFPEGVAGSAGTLVDPIPGVNRLLTHLAKSNIPMQPIGVSEAGRLILRIGPTIGVDEIRNSADAGKLAMARIAELLT